MAGKPGEINTPVSVELNDKGMAGSLTALSNQINKVIQDLNKAGQAASNAVKKTGEAGSNAMGGTTQQLKVLSQLQAGMKTLVNANATNIFGNTAQFEKIGKMASGINALTAGLESGSKASDKLSTRLRNMNIEAGKLYGGGNPIPQNFWDRKLQVEGALSASKQIERSYTTMMQNVSKLGFADQQKLSPLLAQLNEARNKFSTMAGDNRTGPQLLLNLRSQKQITDELDKQIRLVQQQTKNEDGLLRATQLRAQALLGLSATEREANLRNGANRYAMLLNGRNGGGQFNDQLGSPVTNFRTTGVEAFQRATAAAARTQVELNKALNNGTGAERIQQLIDRYKNLTTLQQQSLALADRQNKPGFLGGIKEGFAGVAGASGGGLAGIGNLVGRVGAFTAAYQGIQLVTSALKDGAKFAVEFEDKLAQLQAISGATGTEMQKLSQNILDVSKNSSNSVIEITEAAQILAQAGYTSAETGKLLQNVVNLSAASGASPAESVDILTSTLGAFQLQVSDATHITDALVSVLNESKLAVNQVQLGLQYLGATAKENNINFETLISTLGAAADAGIRSGSTMATGTRQLLIDLQEPSKKLVAELESIGLTMADVDVKTQGLLPVLRKLKENGFDAFGAVETRAAAMYEVLANNTDNIERLREATLAQNTAAEAAEKRTDSLSARWQIMKNELAGVAKELGDKLIPLLKSLLDVVNVLGEALGTISTVMNGLFEGINGLLVSIPSLNLLFSDGATNVSYWQKQMEASTTALHEATAETQTQKDTLNSLDGEIGSIVNRYDALKKSNADTSYEVNRLSERFPGLRQEFQQTREGADGLIQSMFALRAEMIETLKVKTDLELSKGITSYQDQYQGLNASKGDLLQKYAPAKDRFTLPVNAATAKIADEQNRIVRLLLSTIKNKDGSFSPDLVKRDAGRAALRDFQGGNVSKEEKDRFSTAMNKLISDQLQYASQGGKNAGLRRQSADLGYLSTTNARTSSENSVLYTEDVVRLKSQAQGLDLKGRTNLVKGEIAKVEGELTTLTSALAQAVKDNNQVAIRNIKGMQTVQQNNLRTLKNLTKNTDDEEKEAKKEKNKRPQERGPKSIDVAAALQAQGLHPTSIVRTWDEQNRLYRTLPRGQAANPNNAPHVQERAIDFKNRDDTPDNRALIKRTIEEMGGGNVKFRNHQGTGQHLDVSWSLSDTPRGDKTVQTFSREQALMQQQLDEQANQDVKLAQQDVAAKKKRLAATQNSIDASLTTADITTNTASLEKDFEAYSVARYNLAKKEIAKQKLDSGEAATYLDDVKDQLNSEWKEVVRKSADALAKAMDTFIDERNAIIEQEYNRALQGSRTNIARQEGILQGMNNPGSQVPEYTKVIQQDRIDKAQAAGRNDQLGANQAKIMSERQKLQEIAQRYTANSDLQVLAAGYKKYMEAVRNTTTEIDRLNVEQANLIAQSEGIKQVPANWTEAMNQAVQAWRIQNNAGMSMGDRLRSGLGDAIDSVHGSFQNFFTDIMSGTVGIGKAFGNMAKAIGAALVEMAAKAVATQIFGLLLSFIPGMSGASAGAGAGIGTASGGFGGGMSLGLYKGGLVTPQGMKRYARGGLVDRGIPTRDTVPSLLSKGEFVMRRSSVEDIGHRLVKDMNNRGSAALEGMNDNSSMVIPQTPVNTSVYVVMPEEKPQLGPNDVLAIVSNDVLRNGATKQLIKQVSNGG